MNLMFWKKKTTTEATTEATTEDSAEDSQEKPGDRTASRQSPGRESRDHETAEDTDGETANVNPAHPKRRLIIATTIGVLILAAIGLTTWKVFRPSSKPDTVTVDTPTVNRLISLPEKPLIKLPPIEFSQLRQNQAKDRQADVEALKKSNDELQTQIEALKVEPSQVENSSSVNRQTEIEALKKSNGELQTQIGALKAELPQLEKTQAEQHQTNIDALTKKNSELQAQIEALKKKQQQHPPVSPANQAASKAPLPTRSGDIAIGNKNPKAAAMTLKEVIEAMNASSGDSPKKAAK